MLDGKNAQILVVSIITVFIATVLVPIILSSIGDGITDSVTYKNGDRNLEYVIGDTEPQGTNAQGIITCGDSTPSNNSALCGKDKFTAVSFVTIIAQIISVAGIIGAAGGWALQSYRRDIENASVLIIGAVSAIIIGVVALIVIPLISPLLQDAIIEANLNGDTSTMLLLKLVPLLILVLEALIGGAYLTSVGASRGRTIN